MASVLAQPRPSLKFIGDAHNQLDPQVNHLKRIAASKPKHAVYVVEFRDEPEIREFLGGLGSQTHGEVMDFAEEMIAPPYLSYQSGKLLTIREIVREAHSEGRTADVVPSTPPSGSALGSMRAMVCAMRLQEQIPQSDLRLRVAAEFFQAAAQGIGFSEIEGYALPIMVSAVNKARNSGVENAPVVVLFGAAHISPFIYGLPEADCGLVQLATGIRDGILRHANIEMAVLAAKRMDDQGLRTVSVINQVDKGNISTPDSVKLIAEAIKEIARYKPMLLAAHPAAIASHVEERFRSRQDGNNDAMGAVDHLYLSLRDSIPDELSAETDPDIAGTLKKQQRRAAAVYKEMDREVFASLL